MFWAEILLFTLRGLKQTQVMHLIISVVCSWWDFPHFPLKLWKVLYNFLCICRNDPWWLSSQSDSPEMICCVFRSGLWSLKALYLWLESCFRRTHDLPTTPCHNFLKKVKKLKRTTRYSVLPPHPLDDDIFVLHNGRKGSSIFHRNSPISQSSWNTITPMLRNNNCWSSSRTICCIEEHGQSSLLICGYEIVDHNFTSRRVDCRILPLKCVIRHIVSCLSL